MNDSKKNLLGAILSVSGIVIIAKILGFAKQIVTASAFGATIQTDLIFISEALISNVGYLLLQSLSTAFVPVYIWLSTENPKESKRFVSNAIKVFLLITIILSCVMFFGSSLISRILAPSYSFELTSMLTTYIRIFAPAIVIIIEAALFNALLKANERFVPGELVGVNQSVIIIGLILLFGKQNGPDILVVAFYAYTVFNLLFMMFISREYWDFDLANPFNDSNVQKMFRMLGFLLIGYSVVFVNQQVDKMIVSGLGAGIITAMSFAATLSNFVCTFIGSVCSVLFTYITKYIAEKKDEIAAALVERSLIQMITALLPISVLTVMNSNDIVMIVFGRGKFDIAAVNNCAFALIGYGLLFVPYAIRELFSRFQYAYGDSKRPMINSTIAIVFNILFSITLSFWFGVLGVTIATSLSVLICGVLNIVSSCKQNDFLVICRVLKNIPQWIVGIVICITVSVVGQNLLSDIHVFIRFTAIAINGLCLYSLANYSIIYPLLKGLLKRN